MPSAMVWPPHFGVSPRRLALNDGYMAASTPKIRMSGFIALAATEQPAIRPPPPMGMISASRSGASSRNSTAQTPWPVTMPSSSNAETKT